MTFEQARQAMVADQEFLIEDSAQKLTAMSGAPIETTRAFIRDAVMKTLPQSTKTFLETGRLQLPD